MRYTLILLVSFVCVLGYSQDPFFYSTSNTSLYNNPAFCGLNKSFSADFAYRNQWPNSSTNYQSSVSSANQYLGKGNGVSIQFFTDNAASTTFKRELDLGYSKAFKLAEGHFLVGGLQVAYFQKNLDINKLTFGDMIDPRRGYVYPNQPVQFIDNVQGIDFNGGLMYYNDYVYASFSVKHITEPNESFYQSFAPSPLPRLFFGEIGAKFRIGEDWKIIPHAQFRKQGQFDNFLGGVKVSWKNLYLDGGYQVSDAFYTAFGYHGDHFHCSYNLVSYASLSTSSTYFAHEVCLGIDLKLFKKENENFFDF